MTEVPDLEAQRKKAAEQYRQASSGLEQAQHALELARGHCNIQTLKTNLAAYRWGKAVNALHGSSALTQDVRIAYCAELGVSTQIVAMGRVSGASTIQNLRQLAARVHSEDHMRELTGTCGSYSRILDHLRTGSSAEETKDRHNQRAARSRSRAYGRYAPPQEWSAYLIQQQLTKKEISAALRLTLEAVGPEESFKIWDRAGRPAT